jgi:hypothetical protein
MLKRKEIIIKILFTLSIPFLIATASTGATSEVTTFSAKMVQGSGPLPYNYRIIDKTIHAGGHPLNPANNFGNTDQQTLRILGYLKSQGVKTIIDLENTPWIQTRYQKLLDQAGLKSTDRPGMERNKSGAERAGLHSLQMGRGQDRRGYRPLSS